MAARFAGLPAYPQSGEIEVRHTLPHQKTGLLVQVVQIYRQNATASNQLGQPFDIAAYVGLRFHQIVDTLVNQQTAQQTAGARGVITYLVVGLVVAMLLGLCGGLLGSMWARRRGLL